MKIVLFHAIVDFQIGFIDKLEIDDELKLVRLAGVAEFRAVLVITRFQPHVAAEPATIFAAKVEVVRGIVALAAILAREHVLALLAKNRPVACFNARAVISHFDRAVRHVEARRAGDQGELLHKLFIT